MSGARLGCQWGAAALALALVLVLSAGPAGLGAGARASQPGAPAPVDLIPISAGFGAAIGIDHHAPTDRVIVSVNYSTGLPHNFELIAWDGSRERFSDAAGLTNELKIATVWRSSCQGGFPEGTVFSGNGEPGEILRISPDGAVVENPWLTLPGEPGLLRGALFQDRYCVLGGDLVVVSNAGGVWRVSAAGEAERLADLGTHLEGVSTIPDDPRYGPLAGRILAGAEDARRFYSIGADGDVEEHDLDLAPEDIDLAELGTNFYGVDYGGQRLVGAPASAFAGMEWDLIVAEESGGLWHVAWDAAAATFRTTEIARVGQWEHVTFSPAGVVEIPTATPVRTPTPSPTSTPSQTPTSTPTATPTPRPIYLPLVLDAACAPKPLALALVMDASTSMRRALPDGSPKEAAVRDAAAALVGRLAPEMAAGRVTVAVAGFHDRAWTELPPSGSSEAAVAALDRIAERAAQGTRLDLALAQGEAALAAASRGPDRVLVLLTDGLPNRVPTPVPAGRQEDTVLAAASRARDAGITIFAIGVGDPDAVELVDRIDLPLLRAIAGDPALAAAVDDREGLQAAFDAIGDELACDPLPRWP